MNPFDPMFSTALTPPTGITGSPWDPLPGGGMTGQGPLLGGLAATPPGIPTPPSTDIGGLAPEGDGVVGNTAGGDQSKSGFNADKLVAGLRGAAAPKAPDVVKPSTPALPRQTAIQQGEFMNLLNSL